MTAAWSHFSKGFTRADGLLLVLAVAGMALYLVLLPAEHPDAAASYALGEEDARRAADAFLLESGYALDGYDVAVTLRRDTDLLQGLQTELGRRATRHLLADQGSEVPAYHWRIRYRIDGRDEGSVEPSYVLRLTRDGDVWDFERDWPRPNGPRSISPQTIRRRDPARRVDRRAFRAVWDASMTRPGVEGVTDSTAFLLSDSLLAASFAFIPEDSLWQRDPSALTPFNGSKVLALLKQYEEDPRGSFNAALEPVFAVSLARHHLQRMAWDASSFQADSMWLLPERDHRLAHVRLVRTEPLYGQQIWADAVISAAGALLQLDVDFEVPEASLSVSTGTGTVMVQKEGDRQVRTLEIAALVAEAGLYAVLALVLFIAFFRRLAAQLVDKKAIFVDLMVVILIVAVGVGLIKDFDFSEEVDSTWGLLLLRLLAVSVSSGVVGLFALTLVGAADSLARDVWAKKLRAFSLVRLGAFRNLIVGAALLRGVGVAGVLLGCVAGFLFLFPDAALKMESSTFLNEETWQPMAWRAAWSGLQAYLITVMVFLGLGTFLYQLREKAWFVVGLLVLTMALMQIGPLELRSVPYAWGMSALWGLVLGLAFWHYDFLTCFTGYFGAHLLFTLSEGWLVEGSPVELDVWLGGALVVGLAVLGARGIASGETRRAAAEYIPAYITELKHRERLRSELDVARQVQESFLPRKMPNVPGLDIAAMCLAAQEVGGDYYDFIAVEPGKLAVVVGDVSGKGTQAAFYMTLTKGIIQTLSREGLPPAEVMRRLNTLFCENAPRGTFISMIYGVFDVAARTFTFARAGHNPVILKRSPSQESDLVQPTGLAIGLVSGPRFNQTIEERTINLRIGDVLVFYTDGFSEAMNAVKDQYGDDRLAHKVSDVGQRTATEILHAVAEDVHHFVEAAGRHDDMTMVVVKLDRTAAFAAMAPAHAHLQADA